MKTLVASILVGISFTAEIPPNCGWYLLQPPLHSSGVSIDEIRKRPGWAEADRETVESMFAHSNIASGAPLHQWVHIGSYDTAAECEKARLAKYQASEAKEPALRKEFPGSAPKLTTELAWQARCIAVTDSRLSVR